MPGHSGLEICQQLKASSDTAHIPVLLTVGKLEPFKPDEARRVCADAYIVKPFEASELLSAVAHLEDVAAASDRLKVTTKGAGKSASKNAVSSGSESSWKSRLSVPAAPKSTVRSEPAFHDFRRTRGSQASKAPAARTQRAEETAVIPELPRDITPDELDALSAVAARLDLNAPGQAEAPAPEAPVAEASAAAETTAAEKTPDPPTLIQELTQVTAARFLQDPAPVDGADEPLFEAAPVEAAPVVRQEETAPKPAEETAASEAAAAAIPAVAAEAGAACEIKTVGVPQPAELEPQPEPEPRKLGEVKLEAAAETLAPFEVTPIPAATSIEPAADALEVAEPEVGEPSTIGEQTSAQQEQESAAPSEEEIAEALRLLTPASAAPEAPAPTQESGQEISKLGSPAVRTANDSVSSPRWIAEPMALTPEEASQSLEAEMFGAALADAVGEAPSQNAASKSEPAIQSSAVEETTHAFEESPATAHESVSEFRGPVPEQTTHSVEEIACPVANAEESLPRPGAIRDLCGFPGSGSRRAHDGCCGRGIHDRAASD